MAQNEMERRQFLSIIKQFQGRQEEDNFEGSIVNPTNYLEDLLLRQPSVYYRCVAGSSASRCNLAKPVNPNLEIKMIRLIEEISVTQGTEFVVKIIDRSSRPLPIGKFFGKLMDKPPYEAMKTRSQLMVLMAENPEKYKICQLHLDGPQLGWARPLSKEDRIAKIQLKGRSNCGRACQDDEVIVELMNLDQVCTSSGSNRSLSGQQGAQPCSEISEPSGRVVGVHKQHEKLRYKLFVCEMLDALGTCMRPLCGTVPKISYDNAFARQEYEKQQRKKPNERRSLLKQFGMTTERQRLKEMPYEYANQNLVSVYAPEYKEDTKEFKFIGKSAVRVIKHDCEFLFVVCITSWPVQKYYPQGKVIHVISKLTSFLQGIEMLQIIHGIPLPMDDKEATKEERRIREIVDDHSVKDSRNDFRSHLTVTIDNPETRDMDDAISLKKHKNGSITIGVHITDVAEYVGENTPIDLEARLRATTFYPSQGARQMGARTNHMLPPQLAEKSLSLLEGQVRRCLSVVFNLKADGQVDSWRPCLTLIRSDKRLNKEDVQRVLLGETDSVEPRIAQMLLRLWSVTRQWRIERLGQAAFVRQKDEPYPETSALVEELMIAANCKVGEYLQQRLDSVPAYPIRVQQRPREIDVTQWMKKHGQRAQHSAELSRALKLVGKEVPSSNIPFQMHNEDAESLRAFCQRGDKRGALSLLFDERRFPHLRLAISDWHGLCELAQYSECTSDSRLHFSLGKEGYVHFTSPMRRYADIMVHRALRFCLKAFPKIGSVPINPSVAAQETCSVLSVASIRSRRFQKGSTGAETAMFLKDLPQGVVLQVSRLDEDGIMFQHEFLDNEPRLARLVQFRFLNLCEKPEQNEDAMTVCCKWKARILLHTTAGDERNDGEVRRITAAGWRDPVKVANLATVTSFRPAELLRAKSELHRNNGDFDKCTLSSTGLLDADMNDRKGMAKVYSATDGHGSIVRFYRDIFLVDEFKGQIGAMRNQGVLVPTLKLIEICDTFSICLAHRRRPADSFDRVARRYSQQNYRDIDEYVDVWQGIVSMEAASVSVTNNETFVICDVPLRWKWDAQNKRWLGMFNLTSNFCNSNNLNFTDSVVSESVKSWTKKLENIKKSSRREVKDVTNAVFAAAQAMTRYSEYICLRAKFDENYTWVGHGGVLLVFDGLHCRSVMCRDKSVHFCNFVVFHLNEVSPGQSASQETLTHATIELVMKFLPIRRHELVLQAMRYQSSVSASYSLVRWEEHKNAAGVDSLIYKITLMENNISNSYAISFQDSDGRVRCVPCNERQKEALEAAIEKRISLIWGPPGTGKTTTGVMMVFWFAFINRFRKDAMPPANLNLPNDDEDEDDESIDVDESDENDEEPEEDSDESKERQDIVVAQLAKASEDGFQRVQYRRKSHRRLSSSTSATAASERRRWQMLPRRERQSRRQILCCGPSNRSVDVIIEASRDLLASQCPSMVRVYSEQVERMYYPVPGEIATADEVAPAMRKFALHELIRSEDSDDAYIICGFDLAFKIFIGSDSEPPVSMEEALRQASAKFSRFARYIRNQRLRSKRRGALELVEEEAGEDALVQGCIKLYKDVILKSKERVLQNFEVVLCTTSVSCSTILQRACRFVQIIIDEAGMCTQPELLVPIVGRLNVEIDVPSCLGVAPRTINVKPASEFAERVVLIGDHKQLAPIIQNKTAAELGLSKTFFEMHCLDSVMLNHQYRMHPSLADFPSKRFYTAQDSGGLRTQPSVSWTGVHESETQTLNNAKWTGLNWHRLRKLDLFDSRLANGVRHHGLLTQRNANVLHGCWPGVRRDKPFDTLRDVGVEDFHPMGEEERIVFLHVQGREERTLVATEDGREDSYKNELEIDTVVRVYKEIHSRLSGPDKKDPRRCVAVMSQYRYQVSEIKRRLEAEQLPMPTVSTVIACQGSEFGYVLLSLVRSMPDYDIEANPLPGWERKFLGFITDENQTNVALTRAQRGLIIVGNQKLLRRDPNWSYLLHDLERRGCIPKSASDFPSRTGDHRAMTRSGKMTN